ncbi:MAG: NAD-dependent epimerase/dehydratase family protein [Candidatus Hodarchaeota archaeon]
MSKVLITGGAGFIGSHLVTHFLEEDFHVILFDNLYDPSKGALKNLVMLLQKKDDYSLEVCIGDLRDARRVQDAMQDVDIVIHTAAQTAMVPSLQNPRLDFEINALGSFNILEAARLCESDPIIGYTSTNKVYGRLIKEDVSLVEKKTRWDYVEGSKYYDGISEEYPLDIGGPYGISKNIGDMYTLEYARTYGLKTFVFRMSAIYGELQYAIEVHGWIGWILTRAYQNKSITIFGDGKQVRGILHVSDLINVFDLAIKNIKRAKGHAFNIGGDRRNSFSILEFLTFLKEEFGIEPSRVNYSDWRAIDQKCFIPNCKKAFDMLGWQIKVSKEEGIRRMYDWIRGEC